MPIRTRGSGARISRTIRAEEPSGYDAPNLYHFCFNMPSVGTDPNGEKFVPVGDPSDVQNANHWLDYIHNNPSCIYDDKVREKFTKDYSSNKTIKIKIKPKVGKSWEGDPNGTTSRITGTISIAKRRMNQIDFTTTFIHEETHRVYGAHANWADKIASPTQNDRQPMSNDEYQCYTASEYISHPPRQNWELYE